MNFKDNAFELYNELVQIRRKFRMYPELSFQEYRTSKTIADYLRNLDIEVIEGVARTGVIGIISSDHPGKVAALRADIDALPIQEETDLEYKSLHPGVMHACGHDIHMTCLLGAAKILSLNRHKMKGAVKLIFQPAEEIMQGAEEMIKDNVLENPRVDIIFGLHTNPEIQAGCVGVKEGPVFAAYDSFEIKVKGVSGHAGVPQKANDAIVAAATIIQSLQTIISRNVSPFDNAVVSIGVVSGGKYPNIVCDEVLIKGTVRTFNERVQTKIISQMESIVTNTCKALGAAGELIYKKLSPPVINSKENYQYAKASAQKIVGDVGIIETKMTCGGEDFALYQQIAPGFFYMLGVGKGLEEVNYSWHHPKYSPAELSLPVGAGILAQSAFDFLKTNET